MQFSVQKCTVYKKTEHGFYLSFLDKYAFISKVDSYQLVLGEKYYMFIEKYNKNILDSFNYDQILQLIKREKIVFFCVEKDCNACHRSLLLKRLKEGFDINGYCF